MVAVITIHTQAGATCTIEIQKDYTVVIEAPEKYTKYTGTYNVNSVIPIFNSPKIDARYCDRAYVLTKHDSADLTLFQHRRRPQITNVKALHYTVRTDNVEFAPVNVMITPTSTAAPPGKPTGNGNRNGNGNGGNSVLRQTQAQVALQHEGQAATQYVRAPNGNVSGPQKDPNVHRIQEFLTKNNVGRDPKVELTVRIKNSKDSEESIVISQYNMYRSRPSLGGMPDQLVTLPSDFDTAYDLIQLRVEGWDDDYKKDVDSDIAIKFNELVQDVWPRFERADNDENKNVVTVLRDLSLNGAQAAPQAISGLRGNGNVVGSRPFSHERNRRNHLR